MRKLAAELVGTYFLVLTVGIAVTRMNMLAPLAIGGVLMVMVYAGGHISGAHFNPAVTLAVLVRGRISSAAAGGYVVSQVIGALLAAVTRPLRRSCGRARVPRPEQRRPGAGRTGGGSGARAARPRRNRGDHMNLDRFDLA
jgi:hypothetical protein